MPTNHKPKVKSDSGLSATPEELAAYQAALEKSSGGSPVMVMGSQTPDNQVRQAVQALGQGTQPNPNWVEMHKQQIQAVPQLPPEDISGTIPDQSFPPDVLPQSKTIGKPAEPTSNKAMQDAMIRAFSGLPNKR